MPTATFVGTKIVSVDDADVPAEGVTGLPKNEADTPGGPENERFTADAKSLIELRSTVTDPDVP